MSLLSVAEYSFTGTLTSPNDTAPFQMARMLTSIGSRHVPWLPRKADARGQG